MSPPISPRFSGLFPRPLLRALRPLLAAAAVASNTHGAAPGLDGPQAIHPFLNGAFTFGEPDGGNAWTVTQTYQNISIALPTWLAPYPGTNKLICVAKEGRIFLFDDDPEASVTETFLDLRDQTFAQVDSGMNCIAFHPDFGKAGSPNRGYVYVTYKWLQPGSTGSEAYWRLSRFTVPDGSQAADRSSELVLVQQYDRQQFHDSGCMMFGPDGFLYYGIGDEGGANDQFNVGQRISERLFSGIMRIDVDQDLSRSHPIRRQPSQIPMAAGWPNSYTANYTIPNDNPFVNASGANLEEFYAIGLRQPYRFSFDEATGRTWIGEVGQDGQEEINFLARGANYGWPFREGTVAGPQAKPLNVQGTLTAPAWTVTHGPDGCIIGGFVYRGSAYPDLQGRYLAVDNVSGHIRAFTESDGKVSAEILADMPSGSVYSGTSTIGRDTHGEPVFVRIDGYSAPGRFYKLAPRPRTEAHTGWFRFEDQSSVNTTGFVAANPAAATTSDYGSDVTLVARRDDGGSANVIYDSGSGVVSPTAGLSATGIRTRGLPELAAPGNYPGALETSNPFAATDDFTVELSFRPGEGSLQEGTYQTFIGLDGLTGAAASDTEAGEPIQPFRLMRWGRTSTAPIALRDGDLLLSVRCYNPKTAAWVSLPLRLMDATAFQSGKWYHLAIVGDSKAGKVTAYSYNGSSYTVVGTASGYPGNLQGGIWSVGRGCFRGQASDYAADCRFDEVRIVNEALPVQKLLYGSTSYVSPPTAAPPSLLSRTGVFSDLATLTPEQGVIPYGVNSPLWSDGAVKYRWVAIPNDGTHDTADEKIAFSPDQPWSFPPGTVFIKHFELPIDPSRPGITRRLETRFLIIASSGEPYGLTYRWRPDGSEADLLPGTLSEDIPIAQPGGGTRSQTWTYPSRTDCRICHNANAGYVLGMNTHQLNGNFTYPQTGRTANQLETLASLGWFDSTYRAANLPWYPKGAGISDSSASLETRVRSYLDSNCAQCHRPSGARALFDARFTTPVASQGLIGGALEAAVDPADRIIAPGDPDHSILRLRHATLGATKMPPLAKNVIDDQAVTLISDWISSLSPGPVATLTAPATAAGGFQAALHFSAPVTGLTPDDFSIYGGTVTFVIGGGADYVVSIQPGSSGSVVSLSLPAGVAADVSGRGNYASAPISIRVVEPGLAAWLAFDERAGNTAADSSGAGNPGTLVGMSSSDRVSGRMGGALSFEGTGKRVNLANRAPGDFTLSFWLRTAKSFPVTNSPDKGWILASAATTGNAADFLVAGTSNAAGVDRISFQTGRKNAAPLVLHGISSVNSGQWVHIAVTRASGTGAMAIYVDGLLQSSRTGSTGLLDSNPVLSLGGSTATGALGFQGALDDFKVYNRVLLPAEILALSGGSSVSPKAYSAWAESNLEGLPYLQEPDLDLDGDGLSNFAEYAFGSSPLVPDTAAASVLSGPDGSVSVTYRRLEPPSPLAYEVQYSTDLVNWTTVSAPALSDIAIAATSQPEYQTVTQSFMPPQAERRLFFRVLAASN